MIKVTYDDLKKCAALAREAKDINERLERLRSLAERCTSTVRQAGGGGSPSSGDRIGDWVSKLCDMEQEGQMRAAAYMDHVAIVDQAISEGVENSDQRTILRLRYVDGLTWEAISDQTHYSDRWCFKLHEHGLRAMGMR